MMQYFSPGGDYYIGDCMPFSHDGMFHIFYLLDQEHHRGSGGLGGHQWAHMSTTDLQHWEHHPLALAIDHEWESSICTGSVFAHNSKYRAYYSIRKPDWTQYLGLAISDDAVNFTKCEPNPFFSSPAGYSPTDCRDPFVFEHDGVFHMITSTSLNPSPTPGRGGCLGHLVSHDLKDWTMQAPFLVPGLPGVPECADLFQWGDWYYLLFSHGLVTHYRMARSPLGPWLHPGQDILDGRASRVMKTAAFGDRRIGVSWIGSRADDSAGYEWGGNMLIRELLQLRDGKLGIKFLDETMQEGRKVGFDVRPLAGCEVGPGQVRVQGQGLAAGSTELPFACRIRVNVSPETNAVQYGLMLRAGDDFGSGLELVFSPLERTVCLGNEVITQVDGLDQTFELDIAMLGDIVDVCIGNRRTIVTRSQQRGTAAYLWSLDCEVTFAGTVVEELNMA